MAADPRKRQKKLQRRAAKSKSKHVALMREKSTGLPERLAAAADCPIVDSLVTLNLWDNGLGWVILSRQVPSGGIAYAIFLVDRFCLGVKDVMVGIRSRFQYTDQLVGKLQSQYKTKKISPATARRFVESAVEYARTFGLKPHSDYQRARLIFGSIDPAEATEELEFGKDGKPFFISGPNDNAARCREILACLERATGPGGSDFLMQIHPTAGNGIEMLEYGADDNSPDQD